MKNNNYTTCVLPKGTVASINQNGMPYGGIFPESITAFIEIYQNGFFQHVDMPNYWRTVNLLCVFGFAGNHNSSYLRSKA
jgi:hypothetical protein